MVNASVSTNRFNTVALGLLASLATLLAVVGIAGVMSYVVGLRTREIGVRIALGARSSQVQRLIVRQGLRPVLAGVALGLLGSWWLTELLRSALFEVTPRDSVTLIAAPVFFVLVALVACWWPAARAGRVSPTVALRSE